ncbi:MAG TPA: TadE/TadG family type IV pilus assembly protein [Pyrinomonadaceae bacterium]|nr:TadE/TadG family type IV pilus assembly protein [Pyrinomonadaceae bacterium]
MHPRLRKIRALRRLRRFFKANRGLKNERGVQLVELAIVVPILVMLFAATAEFGRYFYEYTTLSKASRAGARYLATAPVLPAEDVAAKNIVVYGNTAGTGSPILYGLTTANVTITRQGGVPVVPQTVKVQITDFKHQPLFNLGKLSNNQSLSLNVDVKPSVTMRYLLTQPPI